MPPSSTSKLTIRGYPKFVNGNVSGSAVATFTLQLNPEQFTVGHELSVDTSGEDEPAAASGVPVAIWRMNSGMSMLVGQAVTQGASWQK